MTPPRLPGPLPGRLLRFYALAVMDAEGPLYGYMLAERIADRTDGGWRPGAGAIYPALETLTRERLARVSDEGRRRVYRITRQGRDLLRRIRRGMLLRTRGGPDLSRLWSEIAGGSDPGQFLFENFRRRLDGVESYLARDDLDPVRRETLREQVRDELQMAERRLGNGAPPRARTRRRTREART